MTIKALSLFANVGIGEWYLKDINIDVVVANELLKDRAEFYRELHPNTTMINGDISDLNIYNKIKDTCSDIDLIIATPPCQGMSIANAKRADKNDPRNTLIKSVVSLINDIKPSYALIENVPGMLKTYINENDNQLLIMDYLENTLSDEYTYQYKVLDAADYGTPQHRKRLIVVIYKKGLDYSFPEKQDHITVSDAIGHLESIESNEQTNKPWHFGRKHNDNHITWMKHTPTGKTAFDNEIHYPKTIDKKTGEERMIKGFKTTYKRINWDKPSPTVGMTNGSINSQNNVHPGKPLTDGTYTDARVLSVRELLLLCGLPENAFDNFQDKKENFIRDVLGECFPPNFSKAILSGFCKVSS